MEIRFGDPNKKFKDLFKIKWDSSLYFLIVTNIIVIIIATLEKWDTPTLLFIYWCQSVIIGIFSFIRILNLKNFTTENFTLNGNKVEPTKSTKNKTAFFFLFHYGFFHLVYFSFIVGTFNTQINFASIVGLSVGLFFINHLFSFIKNFKQDTKRVQNIGKVMSSPYSRIIPMHLTIIFGFAFFRNGMIFFLVLKAIADIIMHNREHQDSTPPIVKI